MPRSSVSWNVRVGIFVSSVRNHSFVLLIYRINSTCRSKNRLTRYIETICNSTLLRFLEFRSYFYQHVALCFDVSDVEHSSSFSQEEKPLTRSPLHDVSILASLIQHLSEARTEKRGAICIPSVLSTTARAYARVRGKKGRECLLARTGWLGDLRAAISCGQTLLANTVDLRAIDSTIGVACSTNTRCHSIFAAENSVCLYFSFFSSVSFVPAPASRN